MTKPWFKAYHFQLHPQADAAALLLASANWDRQLQKCRGLMHRELARQVDGSWVDMTVWQSRRASGSDLAFSEERVFIDMVKLIDPKSLRFTQGAAPSGCDPFSDWFEQAASTILSQQPKRPHYEQSRAVTANR
ncbi:hypothetical protein [Saccharophagus degradans]|uniref:ABM domain-containing protein n=1 Tax=Saccharophagus degradans TaxID=86304 RepID=A0AAW7X3L7_9GAMM|nr:hypothetical protein [Saccharophagus degradans]MDO6422125.1 hypothetical protein [Saccharophagus degradans]MDO6609320.1 hypothetical protein [Saccharophagus degradans]